MSKRVTLLILLLLAAALGATAYFVADIDLPSGVREVPVEINLDW